MSSLYLITGFLGAGKTTFLKNMVRCFPGRKLALIVNEFGREGVDGALLSELGVAMTEIDNGSIFCSCRLDQFESALAGTLAQGPDVILVEASGLADPTSVRKVLDQPARFPGLVYAGAICLVDAGQFHKVFATTRVCALQLAVSDLVLINQTDLAAPEAVARVRAEVLAQRPGCQVHETTFGQLEASWLSALSAPPARTSAAVPHVKDITLQKFTLVLDEILSAAALESLLSLFAGDTYRIKGFAPLAEGLFLVDCVGPQIQLTPWPGMAPNPGRLSVLFGNGQNARRSVQTAIDRRSGLHIE